MKKRISRRRFTQSIAVAGSSFWFGSVAGQDKKEAANDRLRIGIIGAAGQGEYNLNEVAAAGGEIVALCDVDEKRAGKAREKFPEAKFYVDFRRLIDANGLDAVVISTPDHTHAVATMAALKAGLHVYCEKPLGHTVHEARLVAETAAKHKRVTQMGTQIHAGSNYRRIVEIVQSGAIGQVRDVHVWSDKVHGGGDRPKETPPVPAGLHYDLWLGPAPERPYHPTYIPFHWRNWWDFGGGTLADMACHHMDLPYWALKLRYPNKVSAEGSQPVHAETAAKWLIVNYEFPARDNLPPVRLTWYDGRKRPPAFSEGKLPKWGDGTLFVGDKGLLLADYDRYKLLPDADFVGFQPPARSVPDSIGHHREWLSACRTGTLPTCNFDYGGALTETVLLGNVSYRLGKLVLWDADSLTARNEPDADQYVRKEYRKPWAL